MEVEEVEEGEEDGNDEEAVRREEGEREVEVAVAAVVGVFSVD
jgi:hypothetical protein